MVFARRSVAKNPKQCSKDDSVTEANWDLFRLFSVVARTGSVNRAAHELGMSQPTLSRRLKELERCVAAPLFFRASSGVKLTQEGEDLQRSAGDMMLAFESFQRDLRSRVGQRSSVVRISATEGMTKHWLLPRVKELRRRNSRIYLEIISTVNQQSVATSDLDYVIRMGLTRCWALELAPHGVRVNAVAAGPTESGALTGMMGLSLEQAALIREQERARIPLGRRGVPDDIAEWIVQLAGPASEWVTGQVIAIDGGLGLASTTTTKLS
jgi:DNA-binding transcriptional LysR family regulator